VRTKFADRQPPKKRASVLTVAQSLLKILGMEDQEEEMLDYVPDRAFNDLRYTVNSERYVVQVWASILHHIYNLLAFYQAKGPGMEGRDALGRRLKGDSEVVHGKLCALW
jgi:hypothetical protein